MVARVMQNFNLKDLILVRPREKWPNKKTINASKSASNIINKAKVFVGNQSCALAIAEGLKKTIVQETCKWIPNCCFSREGFYTFHDTGNYRMIGSSNPLDSFFGVDVEEVEDPITVNITNTPYGLYPYKRFANHFYRMKTHD